MAKLRSSSFRSRTMWFMLGIWCHWIIIRQNCYCHKRCSQCCFITINISFMRLRKLRMFRRLFELCLVIYVKHWCLQFSLSTIYIRIRCCPTMHINMLFRFWTSCIILCWWSRSLSCSRTRISRYFNKRTNWNCFRCLWRFLLILWRCLYSNIRPISWWTCC